MATDTDNWTEAYIGRKPCGCFAAAVVIEPDHLDRTAEDVAEFVKSGYTVERVPLEKANELLAGWVKCPHKQAHVRAEGGGVKP